MDSIISEITRFSLSVSVTNPKWPLLAILTLALQMLSLRRSPSDAVFPPPVEGATYDTSGTFQVQVSYNWNLTVESAGHQQHYNEDSPCVRAL
jgi:hypothetical protein